MRSNAHFQAAVLAVALMVLVAVEARGQSQPPKPTKTRTAERGGARGDVQPATNIAPAGAASRVQTTQARTPAARGAAAAGAAQPPADAAKVAAPKAPFVLSEAQEKLLDQILIKWEKQSDKVKTFRCDFTRWEYDSAFGNPKDDFKKSEGQGEIRYKAPDCGAFVITSLREFDPARKAEVPKTEGLDHWMCDGKAIFEFNSQKKQLIERRLPPELQGKAISDGPLPFIFGAKMDQLKRRYWMRDVTPKEEIGKTIWLEAVPKYQQDAANFQSATVILRESDFMPYALRVLLPGGKANSDYHFASSKVNDPLAVFNFIAPRLSPLMMATGWKHVVEQDPAESPKKPQPPAGEAAQAKRPAAATERK